MRAELRRRSIVLLAAAVVVAVLAGILLQVFQAPPTPAALALVDDTTLLVLQGRVSVQRGDAPLMDVAADMTLRVGDRVRTGPESYAVITYFDGSTTEIEPNTEIVLRRLERLPAGGQSISFHQEIGLTWNRVERLISPNSRFETSTASSVAFVRGTEYKVLVEPTQRTVVEVVSDTVVVEGAGTTVVVESGFQTSVDPQQTPTPPIPVPPARFSLRLELEGPIQVFLTDRRNRSVGFHPGVDAYSSQIPGARYFEASGRSVLEVPNPDGAYEVVLKAQAAGGSYGLDIIALVDGQPVAWRGGGLARPLPKERIDGTIVAGQLLGTRFAFRDGRVLDVRRPPVVVQGPPSGSRTAFVRGGEPLVPSEPSAPFLGPGSAFAAPVVLAPSPSPTVAPPSTTPAPAGPAPAVTGSPAATVVADPAITPAVTFTSTPVVAPASPSPVIVRDVLTSTPIPPSASSTALSPTETPSSTPTIVLVQLCRRLGLGGRPYDLVTVPESGVAGALSRGDVLPVGGSCPTATATLAPRLSVTATATATASPTPTVQITGRLRGPTAAPGGIRGVWLRARLYTESCADCAATQSNVTTPDGSSHETGGQTVCYRLDAFAGPALLGGTDVVCAAPLIASFPASGAPGLPAQLRDLGLLSRHAPPPR